MIPSEEIDQLMCQPSALIDAMEHLGITLEQKKKDDLYGLRRREIMYLTEESSIGAEFADYYRDPKNIAKYDLERANYALKQFSCIAAAATLYTLEEFIAAATDEQAVLAKLKSDRGLNHIEHIRLVRQDGRLFGNTMDFEWPVFEEQIRNRAQTDGFNVIFIRRKQKR